MNILVVEDDELVANLVRLIFEREGHEVTQIDDGGEAERAINEQLSLFLRQSWPVDLVYSHGAGEPARADA